MSTTANIIFPLLSRNYSTFIDGDLTESTIARLSSNPFTIKVIDGEVSYPSNVVLGFYRYGIRFASTEITGWSYEDGGVVKFTTSLGNWFTIKCPAVCAAFTYTKVVYHYNDGYELCLTGTLFVPDGEWDEEREKWYNELKDNGDYIYKGVYTVREPLMDKLIPIAKRYNSFGPFEFNIRKSIAQEALSLALNRGERDFIKWYLREGSNR